MHYRMSRAQARAKGLKIDNHCYPNVAYKGPRFVPTEWFFVCTEGEESLELALTAAKSKKRNG